MRDTLFIEAVSRPSQHRPWWSRWLVVLGASLWFWPILCVRVEPELQGVGGVAFQPVAVFTALALIIIYRSPRVKIRPWMVVTAGLVLGLCLLLRLNGTSQVLGLVAFALQSVSSAIIAVAWITRQSLEGRYIATIVAVSLFLPFLYNWLLGFVSGAIESVFLVAAPLVSAGLWLVDRHTRYPRMAQDANRQPGEQVDEPSGELTLGSYRLSILKLAILMLFTVVEADSMAANTQLASQASGADAVMVFPWLSAVFCVFVFVCDSRRCEVRPSVALMWLCPTMVLGLVLCALTDSVDVPPAAVATISSFVVFASVFSVQYLVMSLIQQEGLSPVLAQGMALLLFAFVDCVGAGLDAFAPGNEVLRTILSTPAGRLVDILVLACIPALLCLDLLAQSTRVDSLAGKEGTGASGKSANQPASQADNASRIERFSAVHTLSPRETEVFEKVITGRSGPMIARELFVTTGTVKTHLQHIYAKTGAKGRYDLLEMYEKFEA